MRSVGLDVHLDFCEVAIVEDYYRTMSLDEDSDTPLFNVRGLFRQPG